MSTVKSNMGFTLVELLVTILVLGVITAFAVPNFQRSLNNAKMRDSANQLKTFFYAAKSRSTLRRVPTFSPEANSDNRKWSFISRVGGKTVKKIAIDDDVTVTLTSGSLTDGVLFNKLGQLQLPDSDLAFRVCIDGSGIKSYVTTITQAGGIEVTRGAICS